MENLGEEGVMSLSDLMKQLDNFPKHSRTTREIGARLSMNRSKGFHRIERTQRQGVSVVIWQFEGVLPDIPKSTKHDWEKRLSLKG